MNEHTFTIVDVETTGGSAYAHRIIEIGAIRVEHGEVVRQYQTLLNPGTPIPYFITKLTGITDDDVLTAPSFDEVKDEVLEMFDGAVFVAHNAPFDFGFIKQEFKRVGYDFGMDTLCSVNLSRTLFPEHRRHNLDEIIKRFAITCPNRHRGLDDALVVWEFMQHVEQSIPAVELDQVLRRMIGQSGSAKKRRKTRNELEYTPIVHET